MQTIEFLRPTASHPSHLAAIEKRDLHACHRERLDRAPEDAPGPRRPDRSIAADRLGRLVAMGVFVCHMVDQRKQIQLRSVSGVTNQPMESGEANRSVGRRPRRASQCKQRCLLDHG